MRDIRVTFEDTEFEKIKTRKGNLSWHDFILKCAGEKR